MMRRILLQVLAASVVACLTVPAALAIDRQAIPEPLQAWIPWVLDDVTTETCPLLYDSKQHVCLWYGPLQLDIGNEGGKFNFPVQVDIETWVTLPGDQSNWPRAVKVNGSQQPITEQEGLPVIRLEKGQYLIDGEFVWRTTPRTIQLPLLVGIVQLKYQQRQIHRPLHDNNGLLWLEGQKPVQKADNDHLQLQVFRHITDSVPLRVQTLLQMDIAGAARTIDLPGALLENQEPLNIESELPWRLSSYGALEIEARPGAWSITIDSRSTAPATALKAPLGEEDWPAEEFWVFKAQPGIREVEITNGTPIDPTQTGLPENWHGLPAYRMIGGEYLQIVEIRRGDINPSANQLRLRRQIWLDFDGVGSTWHDRISGEMRRDWRLQMQTPMELGRVAINGKNQSITRDEKGRASVEIRQRKLSLDADSRYLGQWGDMPVNGWVHDFERVETRLHMPPGWRLIHANGVEHISSSWLNNWSMLDFFLILLIIFACFYLGRWSWSVLAALLLVLIWQDPDAPQLVWLNILAALALYRYLPKGRIHQLSRLYLFGSGLTLILLAFPWFADSVRIAIFPQLEHSAAHQISRPVAAAAPSKSVSAKKALEQVASDTSIQESKSFDYPDRRVRQRGYLSVQMDPDTRVQTGPGLPSWQWNEVVLRWNGPVLERQKMSLVLLPPAISRLINTVKLILFIVFCYCLAKPMLTMFRMNHAPSIPVVLLLMLGVSGTLQTTPSQAQNIPNPEILQELRTRLLEGPECQPWCAHIEHLAIKLNNQQLTMRIQVQVQAETAIPLPSGRGTWLIQALFVNGNARSPLNRRNNVRWLRLSPGRQQILLAATVEGRRRLSIEFPLLPMDLDVSAPQWQVSGIDIDGTVQSQLEFERLSASIDSRSNMPKKDELPVFFQLERTLYLGVEWRMTTKLVRLSSPEAGTSTILAIPLLPGESVLSSTHRVQGKTLEVAVPADKDRVQWRSKLEIRPEIRLKASENTPWMEFWQLSVSPLWHIDFDGIDAIQTNPGERQWMPAWRPWPGESLQISVSRHSGAEGPTLTIDNSRLDSRYGEEGSKHHLNLRLRSSLGGHHVISIPDGAKLQRISINRQEQALRQTTRKIVLPIKPGQHSVDIHWRQDGPTNGITETPAVDLGTNSVNSEHRLFMPESRWILYLSGPRLGPAVLIWSVVALFAVLATIIGRFGKSPLTAWQWFLLAIGLSQSSHWTLLIVTGWILFLYRHPNWNQRYRPFWFNCQQVFMLLITLIVVVLFVEAIRNGLLGHPEMQITGNDSTARQLIWYSDRIDKGLLPSARVYSVPILVYRLLMLAWALWLAHSLLNWLKWAWKQFGRNGYWRPLGWFTRKKHEAEQEPDASGLQGEPAPKT